MELGDFTKLAKEYVNRVGYSETALGVLKDHIEARKGAIQAVADVGFGERGPARLCCGAQRRHAGGGDQAL